ncbi:MAG: DUF2240 family protein [Thermoplasmata archaeon]|nr:DUF2240 family protein [Thermoplasmata archaeon]
MTISETKRVVKFLFERNGKSELTEQQLELTASMELRWFTPTNAKRLIEIARDLEILKSTDEDTLVLNFDPAEIKIPMGFKPHENLLEKLEDKYKELSAQIEEAQEVAAGGTKDKGTAKKHDPEALDRSQDDLFMKIINKIAETKDLEKTEVISKINKRQRERGFEIEVLALIIAREHGVDITEFLDEADREMAIRVKEQF